MTRQRPPCGENLRPGIDRRRPLKGVAPVLERDESDFALGFAGFWTGKWIGAGVAGQEFFHGFVHTVPSFDLRVQGREDDFGRVAR